MSIEAFPLTWPDGRPRTPARLRIRARFKSTFDRSRRDLFAELKRLRTSGIILSTNIQIRNDGMPYASGTAGRAVRNDPGVAVYFKLKGKNMAFACDRWDRIEDNMQALMKTIEAIRGIERWGSGDMVERAFTGFAALPAPEPKEHWTTVLGVAKHADLDFIEDTYRRKMKSAHPDLGGDHVRAQALNRAIEQARLEKGARA